MSLFQKGLLAFVVVIIIAVATVAILVGYRAETAFRRYATLYSGRTQMLAGALMSYYEQQGSWAGLQDALPTLALPGRGHGRGMGAPGMDGAYIVADAERHVVASTMEGIRETRLSVDEAAASLPLTSDGDLIGYLTMAPDSHVGMVLDAPAEAFLVRLRWALFLGGGVAFLAALIMAGLLTRSIISPIGSLSRQAEVIASGNFDVRADVGGQDEIARLAKTFNEMAASLQRAEEARQAQTADIAHELRNPLAVLQSSLEAFADGIVAPTPENIEPALHQVQTLNRLVEDLRTLALADAGQLRLDAHPIDLGALIRQVTESYRDTFHAKNIALTVAVSEDLPEVAADYARIIQVLNNILSNAARYVTEGADVRITTIAEDNGVTVRIIDTGPGIPEAARLHLFDRFWRAEPSRSRETGGSGLGLAIAQRIVETHGGRIWAEPTPGGGLTIVFWLPAA